MNSINEVAEDENNSDVDMLSSPGKREDISKNSSEFFKQGNSAEFDELVMDLTGEVSLVDIIKSNDGYVESCAESCVVWMLLGNGIDCAIVYTKFGILCWEICFGFPRP